MLHREDQTPSAKKSPDNQHHLLPKHAANGLSHGCTTSALVSAILGTILHPHPNPMALLIHPVLLVRPDTKGYYREEVKPRRCNKWEIRKPNMFGSSRRANPENVAESKAVMPDKANVSIFDLFEWRNITPTIFRRR